MNRCFLCGRKMVKQEGISYELCSNPKCIRSKPLAEPKDVTQEKDKDE